MKTIRLTLIVFLQLFLLREIITSNYEIILDRFDVLLGDEDQVCENLGVRIKKFNRTTYVADGVIRTKMAIDNSHRVGFKAFNMAGGQYKMMFQRLLGRSCDFLYEDHMRPFVEDFFSKTNLSEWVWGLCPLEEKTFVMSNYAPAAIGDHIPAYVPGGEKWKLDVYLVDNDTNTLGGIVVYATLRTNYTLLRYGG